MTEQRRFAAILVSDVVGYSKLIGSDETGTLAQLESLRTEIIEPQIAKHAGRLFKSVGDGFLVEFASAVQAVICAKAIQEVNGRGGLPLRIGIHLGDVVVQGDDLMGDGVNVAARIEGIAEPGGIAITRAVHEQVRDKLDLGFTDKGEIDLKNIQRPVQVFVIGGAKLDQPTTALPLPDKPSIAVLPFQNMSGDPDQEYFADGVAEDIITELSRSRALFVIARNSSFTYRGKSVDVRQVSHELKVRYVLEGSVRRSGQRLRVTAQLIDAENGTHLWAERYDRALDDIFVVQDEITEAVAIAIGPAVAESEMRRAMRRSPASLGAWDLYQQGLWQLAKTGPTENERAGQLFERALEQDGMFAAAHVGMARVYFRAGVQYLTLPIDEAARLVSLHSRKAIEADPADANAHASLALSLLMQGEREKAKGVAQHALAINPNCASALLTMGRALVYSSLVAEGRQFLARAERQSPRDIDMRSMRLHVAIAYYFGSSGNRVGGFEGRSGRAELLCPRGVN